MKVCYQFAILLLIVEGCRAAHNCTSFNDKNHGFGCELRNVKPDQENLEISVMAKDNTNKTETDVVWVQIRDSEFDNNLPKGVFDKFDNMEKMMILSSTGFKNLEVAFFDKKITLILMKNTDLESLGENCFEGLGLLKILSLNYNKLTKVHKRAFRDLVNVEKIEMVANAIESLDDDVFANNVNLKMVLMYKNKLKVISAQLFSRNVNLESFQLQENQISQIEKGFYTPLNKLTRADLGSNVCISETIILTRYIQWSSHQFKFKDCNNNYALMKSTNDVITSVQSKIDGLEMQVNSTVERVSNDMKVLEGKFDNTTALEEFKTNLLQFFEADKEQMKKAYSNDLSNITSNVRGEMMDEIEKTVETALGKTQEARHEQLVSNDFEDFRKEFSSKFSFIYFTLFVLICFMCFTTFLIFKKLGVFPTKSYQCDNRHLIDAEVC